MLNGLDLFSGIGGLGVALSPWVRPITYCEIDRYAQGVLLSQIGRGSIPLAPIWDDIRSLKGNDLGAVDIIYAGFPCQDISVAGNGAGLEGKRSGLVFEIFRLIDEIKPRFVFLENVPAIRTRGGERVVKELASRGYDCRWDVLSAFDVGAPHLRKRWFLLAYSNRDGLQELKKLDSEPLAVCETGEFGNDVNRLCDSLPYSGREFLRDEQRRKRRANRDGQAVLGDDGETRNLANSEEPRLEGRGEGLPRHSGSAVSDETFLADAPGVAEREQNYETGTEPRQGTREGSSGGSERSGDSGGAAHWAIEPDVGRVAHGVPKRVDRLRGLGNAVVPLQAREAFERLMGLK